MQELGITQWVIDIKILKKGKTKPGKRLEHQPPTPKWRKQRPERTARLDPRRLTRFSSFAASSGPYDKFGISFVHSHHEGGVATLFDSITSSSFRSLLNALSSWFWRFLYKNKTYCVSNHDYQNKTLPKTRSRNINSTRIKVRQVDEMEEP